MYAIRSYYGIPFSSPSFIIQYAARSFTDPNGLCPSSLAKYVDLSFDNDSNFTKGVFPTRFKTSESEMIFVAIIISPF